MISEHRTMEPVKLVEIKNIKIKIPPRTGRLAERMRYYDDAISKLRNGKAVLFPLDGANPRSIMMRITRASNRVGTKLNVGIATYEGVEYVYATQADHQLTNTSSTAINHLLTVHDKVGPVDEEEFNEAISSS